MRKYTQLYGGVHQKSSHTPVMINMYQEYTSPGDRPRSYLALGETLTNVRRLPVILGGMIPRKPPKLRLYWKVLMISKITSVCKDFWCTPLYLHQYLLYPVLFGIVPLKGCKPQISSLSIRCSKEMLCKYPGVRTLCYF